MLLSARKKPTWTAAALALSAMLCGCDEDSPADGVEDAGTDEPDASAEADAGADPVYMWTVAVYGPDDTLQYTVLRHELDWNITVDDLKKAREFPGYTGVAPINGHVITGDGESPFATKWEITEELAWKQVGNKLNFGSYSPDDTDGLNFYFQSIRGGDMNFFYGADRTSRAHWNVDTWRIEGDYQDTALPTRSGWSLYNTGNRTGIRDWKGPVMQTFGLENDDTGELDETSRIAVYDPDTQKERTVLEIDSCPGLEQATMDERGDVYFATTYNAPTRALYGKSSPACVIKVKANGTVDESFPSNDLREWTGGFYGVNFRYVGKGKAVANVLHHDRLKNVDFEGEIDPKVAVQIAGEWTDDGFEEPDPTLWEVHVIDLDKGTSKIVTGFKPEHDPNNYSIYFEVDGRTFMNFQFDVEDVTNNAIYELDADAAKVRYVGSIAGDVFDVGRLR